MSLTDEERRAIVLYRIEKAQNALNDINKILPLEVWATIANKYNMQSIMPPRHF